MFSGLRQNERDLLGLWNTRGMKDSHRINAGRKVRKVHYHDRGPTIEISPGSTRGLGRRIERIEAIYGDCCLLHERPQSTDRTGNPAEICGHCRESVRTKGLHIPALDAAKDGTRRI